MWLTAAGTDLDIVWEASLGQYLACGLHTSLVDISYPHCGVESSGDLIILFQTGTATEDLWKPKLADSTLHMLDTSLYWCRSANPLRGFAPNTADHVGMGQRLGCALGGLCDQG